MIVIKCAMFQFTCDVPLAGRANCKIYCNPFHTRGARDHRLHLSKPEERAYIYILHKLNRNILNEQANTLN